MVTILAITLGYLFGSVLCAELAGQIFGCADKYKECDDHNPGTFNAFKVGGFWCGMFTLIGDMLKGFLPIFLYTRYQMNAGLPLTAIGLVLAAPVVGHIYPVFHHFQGGKGIATTFGALLGIFFEWKVVVILALYFLAFSLVVRINPHYYRTLVTYAMTAVTIIAVGLNPQVCFGFVLITAVTVMRMLSSAEEKNKFEVKLLWMH